MRAPALLARAGTAGLAPSPPTSPLAPAAQVSRSPLWLKSRARYCGSILAPVALLWPASGSAQLPLVMGVQPGCVLVCRIAGPYRHCRPRWAQWGGLGPGLPYVDRRLHRFRGPGDSRSRPSHVRGRLGRHSVADRQHRAAAPASGTPGCARPPRLHQHGSTVVALSAKLGIRGPGPGRGWGPGRPIPCASVAAPSTAPSGQRPSHRSLLHPASGPLPSGRTLQTRMGPGEPDLSGPGSRISRPPRPEVTIRHVPIPSPLLANPVRAESARQARPV